MSFSEDPTLQEVAQVIANARRQRKTIDPISKTYGIATVEDAYAIARINTDLKLKAGVKVTGKKIGLTSKVVQQQLGVDQPDMGVLFQDMEHLNGDEIDTASLIQPKVEAEIAFVLGQDIDDPNPSWSEFLLSIEYVVTAIEIVDSVIKDWAITIYDTVADNASSALYVLGDQPVGLGALSLSETAMQMHINGQLVSVGAGASSLGHPLRSAYWLARTMAANNQPLRRGEVILSGSLGPMIPARKGDIVDVSISGLGRVGCRFA